MKKLLLTLVILSFGIGIANAETWDTGIERDSGGGDHHHHVDIPDRQDPLGYGLDIEHDFNVQYGIIKNLGVELQLRNDIQNNEQSGYVVGKIKI